MPPAKPTSDNWLLFLPENEFHEIGLLFSYYLIRLSGRKVIYLGSNVPFPSITTAVKEIKPDILLFFLVHRDSPENLQKYCDQLVKEFKGKMIYLAGNEKLLVSLKTQKKLELLSSIETLEQKLSGIFV
ncbi:MAG: hypothetical protein ABJA79_08395 [Parafilimonas sp.]